MFALGLEFSVRKLLRGGLRAAAIAVCPASSMVTLRQPATETSAPSAFSAAAASSSFCWVRPQIATFAPRAAKFFAMPRLMPLVPPATVNVPEDYPYEDFQHLYLEAWQSGLKGLATYRPNAVLGSVLSVAPTAAAPLQIEDKNRRLALDRLPAPVLSSLRWPGRPELPGGNPAWTFMIDHPFGSTSRRHTIRIRRSPYVAPPSYAPATAALTSPSIRAQARSYSRAPE